MSRQTSLGPKQFEQLQEIYRAACRVRSQLPESHPASVTATRLIAAFTGQDAEQQGAREAWLREVRPAGHA
ncbi:hypothetical protein [Mesorhizobium xinjiangense]|uniref:hypothetical protein n=1 Tax=Mesorhizobium xinjiangense TaxID=2678685 RepID=UPI0012ED749D|nr:hypothetical protein [Mesorhizobium xinjiangense]